VNILIVGMGVIGSFYGWQLSQAGNAVTHYVRRGRKSIIEAEGVRIRCFDLRNGQNQKTETLYRPKVTEQIPTDNDYELVIVAVKVNQIERLLQEIAEGIHKNDVLILQNLWFTDTEGINARLSAERVVYGQPHIVGGGKDSNGIYCTVFGSKNAPTMLGERDGKRTQRLLRISEVMGAADLNPQISSRMLPWLYTHYAEAAGLLAGVMSAGSARKYADSYRNVKESVMVAREGFRVCKALGVSALRVYPQCLYFAPTFLLVPFLQRMYQTDGSQQMIEGHLSHSPDEMVEMFDTVLEAGRSRGMRMPQFEKMKPFVEDFKRRITINEGAT
jgi:ketopantoate reductase